MKHFFFICFIIMGSGAIGQQRHLDSLLILLEKNRGEDTIRMNLLNEIAFTYYSIDPDKGIERAKEAIELAKKMNFSDKLPAAYNNLGVNYRSKGKDTLALSAMEESLALYKKAGNKIGIARLYNNLALIYYNFSDFVTALEYHGEALLIFEELEHEYGAVNTYNNTGVVYLSLTDYPRALEAFLNAHRLTSPTDSLMLGSIATNIGLVYKNLNEYAKSLEYQGTALALYEGMGNKQGTANTLGNIGNLYETTGDFERALDFLDRALTINIEIGNNRRIASNYANKGVLYKGIADYPKALENLLKGVELYDQTNDKENTALVLLELSFVLASATDSQLAANGFEPAKRNDLVLSHQLRSRQLAEESGSLLRQSGVWEALSQTYEARNDIKSSFTAFKNYILFRDSVYNTEKEKEIIQQHIQFDYEKREALLTADHEQEKALGMLEISRQRTIKNSIGAGAVLLLIASVGGYFLYKRRRDAEEKQKQSEFNAQVAEVEMKALRSQMNPHFIFNSLNSISDFILKNNLQAADYYLGKFAKLMRMILENSEQKEIPLSDDLKILETYMELEALRLKEKFTYEIQVDESLDPENTLVPPLLLQPFVENSIWHGFSQMLGQGKILVKAQQMGDMVNFTVEDNGIGRIKSSQYVTGLNGKTKTSMGMRITQDRLNIINKVKKTKAEVVLSDLHQGFKVELKLPHLLGF